MARFRVEVPVAAPVPRVWARLTDWPAHARLAPLTSIRVVGPGDRPGSVFVARTGLGPLAFDDPMRIERFEPPSGASGTGRFRVGKTGRLLRGWVEAEVRPDGQGSLLVWHEELRVPPEALTRFAGPLIGGVAGAAYGAALRRLGREVETEMGGRG
ncbi:SRPBCC family protein [Kineosporia sp. J2-2]|uniref:SRPBCC family protein n=1 Tax=Kineosporia corallincola TaxID=2835133 RepID=A0ABS5TH43_9ACTN|nr:SRPBCC family protein [Kineosporia corallincola]MBT0770412.1 SRPBCC family protein [Kineosporia corallincola]